MSFFRLPPYLKVRGGKVIYQLFIPLTTKYPSFYTCIGKTPKGFLKKSSALKIGVLDGQGGGIGSAVIKKLREEFWES